MENLFDVNGLVFWTEKEIRLRRAFEDYFRQELQAALLETNPAWHTFHHIEAPILTPCSALNPNYTDEDIWAQEGDMPFLALRPETTPGSYAYAKHLLHGIAKPARPPFVVWQSGKSFRREQNQVLKNMRLKEFWQQEFQCFYTDDTLNDYHSAILPAVEKMISEMVRWPCRVVESDRLPTYSRKTVDIEVMTDDKWMEVCSVSLRTDFPEKARFQVKKKVIEKGLLVLEIAIGLDRCVYNFLQRKS